MSLTTDEVAAVLDCGTATVRKLVQRGHLRPIRPGARPLRFTEQAVNALRTRRWSAQARANRSRHGDTLDEVDRLLAAQVSGVSRCGHAQPSLDQVEG